MPRNEEFDWIFDYTLQFLETDKFDAALMDFVDEKCLVFEDAEENKLIYTDIHREFCDHLENLISSNLAEVGITTELFLESCEKARGDRDINSTVFERLMAMEDFNTFKKLMTKRNLELQMESIRSFIHESSNKASNTAESKTSRVLETEADMKRSARTYDSKNVEDDDAKHVEPARTWTQLEKDEIEALQCFSMGDADFDNMSEEEIQELLLQSLVEMEFLHRQEELEHAELEKALLLSLAQEEERLSAMLEDLTTSNHQHCSTPATTVADVRADEKPSGASSKATSSSSPVRERSDKEGLFEAGAKDVTASSTVASAKQEMPQRSLPPIGASAGLNFKLRGDAKPLPSIVHGRGDANATQEVEAAAQALDTKKQAFEASLAATRHQHAAQRQHESQLRDTLASIVDPAELQRRSLHMQQQRDLLIAKKKAERDAKVQQSSGAGSDSKATPASASVSAHDAKIDAADTSRSSSNNNKENNAAEMRRNNLRLALTRRLKQDLRQEELSKQLAAQETQFASLDAQLRQVEEMREEHRQREAVLAQQLQRQQAQIARNVQLSAAALGGNH